MMIHEFEELAGYEVDYNVYVKTIEPMYMASGLSKAEFVKILNKKAFALPTKKQFINRLKKIADRILSDCGHTETISLEVELQEVINEMKARFYGPGAGSMVNHAAGYGRYVKSVEFYDRDYNTIEVIDLVD